MTWEKYAYFPDNLGARPANSCRWTARRPKQCFSTSGSSHRRAGGTYHDVINNNLLLNDWKHALYHVQVFSRTLTDEESVGFTSCKDKLTGGFEGCFFYNDFVRRHRILGGKWMEN